MTSWWYDDGASQGTNQESDEYKALKQQADEYTALLAEKHAELSDVTKQIQEVQSMVTARRRGRLSLCWLLITRSLLGVCLLIDSIMHRALGDRYGTSAP